MAICMAVLQSGCATIVKGDRQEIQITTDPPGAQCEVKRNGDTLAYVDATPASVSVTRNAAGIDVRCKKAGHQSSEEHLTSQFNNVTFGNILLGGLIGVVVDAGSGANYDYATNVYLKLAPTEFKSAEQRDAYFEAWRAELMQDAQRAKSTLASQCRGEQCEQLAQRTDAQVREVAARIDSASAASAVAQTTPSGGGSAGDAGAAGTSVAKGAKWHYRVQSNGRAVGSLTVEAVAVSPNVISERISGESTRSFTLLREVEVGGRPPHFAPVVMLPGGFQLPEAAPYFPDAAPPRPGERWAEVGGEYFVPRVGKRQFPTAVAVTAQESIQVPAGRFDTTKIETQSETFDHHSGHKARIKCMYWYAPAVRRTVKMQISLVSSWPTDSHEETYVLQSYVPGR